MEAEVMTEVPQNLQMLVRLVVRGFYSIEDMLIVDMLVRNICMSEEDLCELLKFERKMLRQRINTLKADKLIQSNVRAVPLEDGKTQKEQYYFINYKSFVNVVKYKLDHIRKKLEMKERDQTSRASFICNNCQRTYTDLEADQLFDMETRQLLCIVCRCEVEEDMSGMPRHDSRILLSNFNEQMEPLFNLLREVENIKLSAEFSEPKPQDFSSIKKTDKDSHGRNERKGNGAADGSKNWSGEATKKQGFQVEGSIDVRINSDNNPDETNVTAKEKPIWLTDATSFITTNITSDENKDNDLVDPTVLSGTQSNNSDDVLVLLQENEKNRKRKDLDSDSDSDESAKEICRVQRSPSGTTRVHQGPQIGMVTPLHRNSMTTMGPRGPIEEITISDDDDGDDGEPMVTVGGESIPLGSITGEVIAKMTQVEKNNYISAYQDYYGAMED